MRTLIIGISVQSYIKFCTSRHFSPIFFVYPIKKMMYDDVGWGSSFLLSLYEVKALVV